MWKLGCKKGGIVIVNTTKSAEQIRKETGIKAKLAVVDASKIAMETMRVPITNTTMLGALVKAAPGLISMERLEAPDRSSLRTDCREEHQVLRTRLRRNRRGGLNSG